MSFLTSTANEVSLVSVAWVSAGRGRHQRHIERELKWLLLHQTISSLNEKQHERIGLRLCFGDMFRFAVCSSPFALRAKPHKALHFSALRPLLLLPTIRMVQYLNSCVGGWYNKRTLPTTILQQTKQRET